MLLGSFASLGLLYYMKWYEKVMKGRRPLCLLHHREEGGGCHLPHMLPTPSTPVGGRKEKATTCPFTAHACLFYACCMLLPCTPLPWLSPWLPSDQRGWGKSREHEHDCWLREGSTKRRADYHCPCSLTGTRLWPLPVNSPHRERSQTGGPLVGGQERVSRNLWFVWFLIASRE